MFLGLMMLICETLGQMQGNPIKSVPKLKANSDFIADSVTHVEKLGQNQVDFLLMRCRTVWRIGERQDFLAL